MKYFWCIILHIVLNTFSSIKSQELDGSIYEDVIFESKIGELMMLEMIPNNAFCNTPDGEKTCICIENHFPIDDDVLHGCRDPCHEFQKKNAECLGINAEDYDCRCKEEHVPMHDDDPCLGCKLGNIEEIKITDLTPDNTVCNATETILHCKCIDNHFPINGDVLNGCRDPCRSFHVRNAECLSLNSQDYYSWCKEGYVPMYDFNPYHGCVNLKAKEKDCKAYDGYVFYDNFGCLRAHNDNETGLDWESARANCTAEGGDLFSPKHKSPILPEQMELNTANDIGYWVGIRRQGNDTFRRVSVYDQSELQENSSLWDGGYPNKEEGSGYCVHYGSQTKLLYNDNCTSSLYGIICQIHDI